MPEFGGNDMTTQTVLEQTKRHPCYSAEGCSNYARIHLPVAPHCNIQCNYCSRKFDCVNESRPGVTSEVLTPEQAQQKYAWVKREIPELSVVGIAGPGDALANWDNTKATILKIKQIDDQVLFCLSTNGLMLPEFAAEIVDLGVRHVTVTVNTVEPQIGARLYQYVLYQGTRYEGIAAAKLLLEKQLAGIAYLAKHGVLVKINTVMVKGVNDRQIPAVAQKMKQLGAFIGNIMPLIPAPGSSFERYPQTSMREIHEMRNLCEAYMPQMRHCQQCRADAVGRLSDDRSREFRMCRCPFTVPAPQSAAGKQYRIAVTSKQGKLVDQHFGHADTFLIFQGDGQTFQAIERRVLKNRYCAGMAECDDEEVKRDRILDDLSDCDAVLTMRIGRQAKDRLWQKGVYSVEFCDTVENGLIYAVDQLRQYDGKGKGLLAKTR